MDTEKVTAPVDEKLVLTIDEMLNAEDVEYETIPTWMVKDPKGSGKLVQGYTRIGSLAAEDIIEWRDTSEAKAKKTMGVRLFVNSLVDINGNRIGTPKHYEAFKKKSNRIQEKVLGEIIKLNGLTQKNDHQVCPNCQTKFVTQVGGDDIKNG